jgi:hypothetical protein
MDASLNTFDPSSNFNAQAPTTKAQQEANMFDQYEQNYQSQQRGGGGGGAKVKTAQQLKPQQPPSSNRQHYSNPFDDEPLPAHKNNRSPEPRGGQAARSTERTLAELASDSLDNFYQDEQVKENMSTVNVGYR